MGILPPLQATLNFVTFVGNLIDLKQFNTILVLHDQATRDQINFLIENLPARKNVDWFLINEFDNTEYWNHIQQQNVRILTALENKKFYPILTRLYKHNNLKNRPKNVIVLSEISK